MENHENDAAGNELFCLFYHEYPHITCKAYITDIITITHVSTHPYVKPFYAMFWYLVI